MLLPKPCALAQQGIKRPSAVLNQVHAAGLLVGGLSRGPGLQVRCVTREPGTTYKRSAPFYSVVSTFDYCSSVSTLQRALETASTCTLGLLLACLAWAACPSIELPLDSTH